MAQEKQETREEEVARVRSYLASQAMRRSPGQLIEALRGRLIAVVLQADPQTHLDIVWGHNEFGNMNWREWLLFARVHTLDHAGQMQAISAVLSSTPQS